MKIQNLLPLLIAFVGFAGYSQISTVNYTFKNKAPLYEIIVDADVLHDFKNLDWDMIRGINTSMGKKAELDSVKLVLKYQYLVMLNNSKLADFSYEIAGLTTDIEMLISESQKRVSELKPIAKAESK